MSEKDDKYMYEINKLEGERDSLRREVERWKEVDRLRSEDDKTSETEWRSLVYTLVDAAGLTRGTSIPEDVAHTKVAIERLQEEIDCLPIEENERLRAIVETRPKPNELKTAVCEYMLQVNRDMEGSFIPPTAIDWLGNGVIAAVANVYQEKREATKATASRNEPAGRE